MAITKLMHMKETPGSNPSGHLKNAIDYILRPEKTKGGLLVGGNCGTTPEMVYQQMMDTKMVYGKNWGRQGYHFVLSFPPGEVTGEEARDLTGEFCERYFKDDYEYVYAAHDDTAHRHGHIIFNSVSRNGMKYRYEKGDWEKYIQVIVNDICKEHGLSYINLEELKNRVGNNHKKWEGKRGHKSWRNLVRQNIDEAIDMSNSYEEFLDIMRGNGYSIRQGNSKEYGEYLSLLPEGAEKPVRDYRLGPDYKVNEIRERIVNKEHYEQVKNAYIQNTDPQLQKIKQTYYHKMPKIQYRYYTKMVFLLTWNNRLRSPYPQAWKFRKDLQQLDKHIEEYRYLQDHQISSPEDLHIHLQSLNEEMEILKSHRTKVWNKRGAKAEESELLSEYMELEASLDTPLSDIEYESVCDRMEEIGNKISVDSLKQLQNETDEQLKQYKKSIKNLKKNMAISKRVENRYPDIQKEHVPDIAIKNKTDKHNKY